MSAIRRQNISVMNMFVNKAANTEIISNGIKSMKNFVNPVKGLLKLIGGIYFN